MRISLVQKGTNVSVFTYDTESKKAQVSDNTSILKKSLKNGITVPGFLISDYGNKSVVKLEDGEQFYRLFKSVYYESVLGGANGQYEWKEEVQEKTKDISKNDVADKVPAAAQKATLLSSILKKNPKNK